MKVIEQKTAKTITLELSGEELQQIKGSWSTLDRLTHEEHDLSDSQHRAITFAISILGTLV